MIRCGIAAVSYGDLLMLLSNQTRPYEKNTGESDRLVEKWSEFLTESFKSGKYLSGRSVKSCMDKIAAEFEAIPRDIIPRIRVGIVGEIYVKYSPLGNNGLESFLASQGCEVMAPGLLDFLLYSMQAGIDDYKLYGGSRTAFETRKIAKAYLSGIKNKIGKAVGAHGFVVPSKFDHVTSLPSGIISLSLIHIEMCIRDRHYQYSDHRRNKKVLGAKGKSAKKSRGKSDKRRNMSLLLQPLINKYYYKHRGHYKVKAFCIKRNKRAEQSAKCRAGKPVKMI